MIRFNFFIVCRLLIDMCIWSDMTLRMTYDMYIPNKKLIPPEFRYFTILKKSEKRNEQY